MTATKKVLLIANPAAGSFRPKKLAYAKAYLEQAGLTCRIALTKRAGCATRFAKHAKADEIVCVMGGDGTVFEAIAGLADNPHTPTLAVLPGGTANVMAAELGIFGRRPALDAVIAGRVKKIYLGEAENSRLKKQKSFVLGSVGLDALAVRITDLKLKKYCGRLAYALSGARAIFSRHPEFAIELPNGRRVKARWLMFMQGRFYGGSFNIAPSQSLQDKDLHLIIFKKAGFFDNMINIIRLFLRRIRGRHIEVMKTKSFKIRYLNEIPSTQLNGELIPGGFDSFSVSKRRFCVIVP